MNKFSNDNSKNNDDALIASVLIIQIKIIIRFLIWNMIIAIINNIVYTFHVCTCTYTYIYISAPINISPCRHPNVRIIDYFKRKAIWRLCWYDDAIISYNSVQNMRGELQRSEECSKPLLRKKCLENPWV